MSGEQRERIEREAFAGPTGTWAERWIPGVCKHERVRCTHGDEIIGRRFRRRVCMACGRSLRGPLPEVCFFSPDGQTHESTRPTPDEKGQQQ